MSARPQRLARPTTETYIAGFTLLAIGLHLYLHFATAVSRQAAFAPLYAALVVGGVPLVLELGKKLVRKEFGSDLLAGISILTACLLGQFLVAAIVVLMLSGGAALEANATARASSVLDALARRIPSHAHRRRDSALGERRPCRNPCRRRLAVFPHEVCPVDGVVLEGQGVMR